MAAVSKQFSMSRLAPQGGSGIGTPISLIGTEVEVGKWGKEVR